MPRKDFDVDSLASYLHLTPQQVERLASRDKIPGRKIGGAWRFPEAEIHHWMEQRMGVLDDSELAHVEGVLQRAASADDNPEISIADKLSLESIAVPLPARTRGKVITAMVDLAAGTGLLWDPPRMAEAIRAREDMQPTAMDNGIALLHPRRPMPSILAEPILALGRIDGGIPFGGAGGILTDIFFLICSTDDQRHLRVLARLARLLSNDSFLEEIRNAPDAFAIREVIIQGEAQFA